MEIDGMESGSQNKPIFNEPQSVEEETMSHEGADKSIENESNPETGLRMEMLDHIASSKFAHFKSQQMGEPELTFDQKRQIAENILCQSPGQFLSRFGRYLKEHHLDLFSGSNDYEVGFHLNQLRRYHCKAKHQVDVKNNRFQALKKLVDEGNYFSEKEMKKRNPLLYQQLVGQFLTKREVKEKDIEEYGDVDKRTWVTILMAQIERDQVKQLRKFQKDEEDGTKEEMDTSDEEEEEENDGSDESEDEGISDYDSECDDVFEKDEKREVLNDAGSEEEEDKNERERTVGRAMKNRSLNDPKHKVSFSPTHARKRRRLLGRKEKELLKEEFITYMYHSFLEGKDTGFDYSQVDLNPEYECLAVRTQDEEEKYFDSESPETVEEEQEQGKAIDGEEDELDAYMKNLKPETTPSDLAGNIRMLL